MRQSGHVAKTKAKEVLKHDDDENLMYTPFK